MALQLDNLNALHPCRAYKYHDAKIQTYQKERRKRIMKSKKLMRMLIIGASIFALAGCGTSNENDITNPDKKDAPNENDSNNTPDGNDSNAVGSMDGDELIIASDLQGSVTEFSDNGCTITPTTSSNDGKAKIAEEAADGYEDEAEKINIKYEDNCIFQRAVMSIRTGKATVNEAAKTDIKKKTSLLLYGNFDDTENFTATKVMIVQYEHE